MEGLKTLNTVWVGKGTGGAGGKQTHGVGNGCL